MESVLSALAGKKTYIMAFLGAAVGLYMAFVPGWVPPDWVNYLLIAGGGAALRAAK